MNLDNIFVNKIEELNCYAQDLKFRNFKQWAENENNTGKMNTFEYKRIQMYHDMRNMISHGGSGRIEFFEEDINFLNKYISIMKKILNIEETKIEEAKKEKISNSKSREKIIYKDAECIELPYTDTFDYKPLKKEFVAYFEKKRPEYKRPGPLYGMAFYCSRHNLGFTLNDILTGKITLDEYVEVLRKHFMYLGSTNLNGRLGAYKDAMKNLLEFSEYKGLLHK